jgi:hypothetical protein
MIIESTIEDAAHGELCGALFYKHVSDALQASVRVGVTMLRNVAEQKAA